MALCLLAGELALDQAVWVRALVGNIALCSRDSHLT